jgi:hypothetical protein
MLRQADRTSFQTFPSKRDQVIAESEGDHATSQDIAELIGRANAWIEIEYAIGPSDQTLEKSQLLPA